jgi:hypothetical protein
MVVVEESFAAKESVTRSSFMVAAEFYPEWSFGGETSSSMMQLVSTDLWKGMVVKVVGRCSKVVDEKNGKNSSQLGKISSSLVHLGQIPMVRSTQLPLYIVGRTTNIDPPQTSFHMTSLFRRHSYHLYCDVSCIHMSS